MARCREKKRRYFLSRLAAAGAAPGAGAASATLSCDSLRCARCVSFFSEPNLDFSLSRSRSRSRSTSLSLSLSSCRFSALSLSDSLSE